MTHRGLTHLTGGEKFVASLHAVFQAKPWLELSWFLVIPLLLNTVIMCPLIIRRAGQAARISAQDRRTRISAAVAAIVGLLSLVYLVVVIL
jgi:hypothetical protein